MLYTLYKFMPRLIIRAPIQEPVLFWSLAKAAAGEGTLGVAGWAIRWCAVVELASTGPDFRHREPTRTGRSRAFVFVLCVGLTLADLRCILVCETLCGHRQVFAS